jgi:Fur family transcriptional regulator, ferric uptake regulator
MFQDMCSQVEACLQRQHYKLTGARKEIIRILNDSTTPLSVQEIHHHLADTTADLASVYRTVNLLCDLGVVVKLEFQEKLYRYELSDAFVPHHHHVICKTCGRIENIFDPCLPEGLEQNIRQQFGFEVESHILEFYGVCANCSASIQK